MSLHLWAKPLSLSDLSLFAYVYLLISQIWYFSDLESLRSWISEILDISDLLDLSDLFDLLDLLDLPDLLDLSGLSNPDC